MTCVLGDACLCPHVDHDASECFDLDMAEAALGGEDSFTSGMAEACGGRPGCGNLECVEHGCEFGIDGRCLNCKCGEPVTAEGGVR